jgi:hypothetical protein
MERADDCDIECTNEEQGVDGGDDGTDILDDPNAAFDKFKGGDDNLDEAEFEAFFQSSGL